MSAYKVLWKLEHVLSALNEYLGVDETVTCTEAKLGTILIDESESIAKRMRTCFELKAINNERAIDALNVALLMSTSALLKHEIAYVLGQMRNRYAVRFLCNVLEDEGEEVIVRHECCEALGAIADASAVAIVEKYCNHSAVEIAETAQLALRCISMAQNQQRIERSKYNSVDPAPSFDNLSYYATHLEELQHIYLDEHKPLFERYRAMMTLRDIASEESIRILCLGFDDKSALFRHEIAFVLGQCMNETAIASLQRVLSDESEDSMVRHEAAEALGSIAKRECRSIVEKYVDDKQDVVRESCIVATDIYDFWHE